MKTDKLSKKLGLIGSCLGVVMFMIFGLLQGVLLGGTAAVKVGGYLFAEGGTAATVLGCAGIVIGVVLAGVVFVVGGFAAGRVAGHVMSACSRKHGAVPSAARN